MKRDLAYRKPSLPKYTGEHATPSNRFAMVMYSLILLLVALTVFATFFAFLLHMNLMKTTEMMIVDDIRRNATARLTLPHCQHFIGNLDKAQHAEWHEAIVSIGDYECRHARNILAQNQYVQYAKAVADKLSICKPDECLDTLWGFGWKSIVVVVVFLMTYAALSNTLFWIGFLRVNTDNHHFKNV